MSSPCKDTPADTVELLLRETNHRCANDLQLVVGLLALQSRRATTEEARLALHDATERVTVLAQARRAMLDPMDQGFEAVLCQTCEALSAQAEPRSILIAVSFAQVPQRLDSNQITTIALAVNELTTNAIKHAFDEGVPGKISVAVRVEDGQVVVTVDDDGLPMPEYGPKNRAGLGLGLVERLIASIGGQVIRPSGGAKMFRLQIPIRRPAPTQKVIAAPPKVT